VVALARHVEVKVAMRMRESGSGHEVVVDDKKVCGRSPDTVDLRYTCDRYLSFFVPEGAVLTVMEHDGTRVDRGSGVAVNMLTATVTEFLTTGQLPTRVGWREHDEWTVLRRRGSEVPGQK
jgi:hypothetical protein